MFENAPKVEFEEVTVGDDGEGAVATHVSVVVKDGEDAVKCSAEKVAAMFEATSDLGDWADGGRAGGGNDGEGAPLIEPPSGQPSAGGYFATHLPVSVTVEEPAAGDSAETMRFKVTPGDGTATRAFLRIRK